MEHNDSNNTFDDSLSHEIYVNIYVIDVILLITNIIGLVSNGIILYVIYKIKSWKTPTYALVSSWAVMDILHLLISPGLYKWYNQIHDISYNFTLQTVVGCLNVTYELGIILILIVLLYLDVIKFFKANYLKILAFIWSLVAVLCICTFIGIADYSFHLSVVFSLLLYTISMVAIIVTCITFIVKKKHLDVDFKLTMAMVCVYVCCALLFGFTVILTVIFEINMALPKEIALLIFAVGEMDSLANLYFLTNLNRTFNIYFYRLFDCRRNKHADKVNIVYEHQTDEDM